MTIEETKKAIEVMQAFVDGKTIEAKNKHLTEWDIVKTPHWQFWRCDYRIKPEPHYRPFKNAEEVMEAIKEHGDWIHADTLQRIIEISNTHIWMGSKAMAYPYLQLLDLGCAFADGTPFGKLEE